MPADFAHRLVSSSSARRERWHTSTASLIFSVAAAAATQARKISRANGALKSIECLHRFRPSFFNDLLGCLCWQPMLRFLGRENHDGRLRASPRVCHQA